MSNGFDQVQEAINLWSHLQGFEQKVKDYETYRQEAVGLAQALQNKLDQMEKAHDVVQHTKEKIHELHNIRCRVSPMDDEWNMASKKFENAMGILLHVLEILQAKYLTKSVEEHKRAAHDFLYSVLEEIEESIGKEKLDTLMLLLPFLQDTLE